jgi:chromosome segregation ATPase
MGLRDFAGYAGSVFAAPVVKARLELLADENRVLRANVADLEAEKAQLLAQAAVLEAEKSRLREQVAHHQERLREKDAELAKLAQRGCGAELVHTADAFRLGLNGL